MRKQKLYTLAAVSEYVNSFEYIPMDVIPGALIDTMILYHPNVTEVFEETYINEWQSAYRRHIYKRDLPKRFVKALETLEEEELNNVI